MDQHASALAFGPFHAHAHEDAEPQDPAPPEGYLELPTFGPFQAHLGPMYHRPVEGGSIVGLWVRGKHLNRGPMMHGGMVCTLADTASHWAARHARHYAGMLLTTGLNVNLMGNAGAGEWVEARAVVLRAGSSAVFTDCRISCGDRIIAQASAQFQVVVRQAR